MRSDPHAPDTHRPARTRLPLAATTLLTVALIAASTGCTSSATADPTPTPSIAVSSTPSPTPTPDPTPTPTTTPQPERPAAMDTVDVNGAIAAVTYFLELYPYAYNTGDVTAMKELSHPECIFCQSATDDAERIRLLGQHQEGSDTRVLSARGTEITSSSWFSIDAQVEQEGYRVEDGAGVVVEEDMTTKTYAMNFAVIHQDGHWLVRAAEFTVE